MNAKSAQPHVSPTEVIERLKEDGVEYFVNSVGEPTVHIPKDNFQQDWPADHQRVSDLVQTVFYELTKEKQTAETRTKPDLQFKNLQPMLNRDCQFLMAMIREECRIGGRRFSEAEAVATESDVIVQGILNYCNRNVSFDDRTAVLHNKLRDLQRSGSISRSQEFPPLTNIFSRRLNRLVSVLEGYGVRVEIRHEEDGSHCKIVRLPHFQMDADPRLVQEKAPDDKNLESSVVNSNKGTDLQLADDTDGEIRYDQPNAKADLKGTTPAKQNGGAQ